MAKLSPTQLSLRYLRKAGYQVAIAEHWFQPPGAAHGRRRDLFGFIDLVAAGHGHCVLVQTTTKHNMKARMRKVQEDCYAPAHELLSVPGISIHFHGWTTIDQVRPSLEIWDQVEQLTDPQRSIPF